MKCLYCGRDLVLNIKKGWVHAEGGLMYWPHPDGGDDHCATPDLRTGNQKPLNEVEESI